LSDAGDSAAAPAAAVKARYYPATGQAIAQDATLAPGIGLGVVLLSVAGDLSPRRISIRDLVASERFSRATRTLQLPDGGTLEVDDGLALSRVLAAAGKPDAIVTRWQHSWRAVLVSLLLSIVAAIVGYVWVLPVVADHLAERVPRSWTNALDDVVVGQLKRQDSMKASDIDSARQDALRARFIGAVSSAEGKAPDVRIYFYKMGAMPNAFALPGGSIVFLDGIVTAAPNDDALVGVFAHEYGHIKHRHGLRTLLRTAAVSAVAAWYFGDFTSLANAAILVSQLSYSRDFETQADDTAIEIMRANKLDTRSLAELFRRMRDHAHTAGKDDDKTADASKKESGKGAGDGADRLGRLPIPEFLSTHPDIERRIERFEKAGATP